MKKKNQDSWVKKSRCLSWFTKTDFLKTIKAYDKKYFLLALFDTAFLGAIALLLWGMSGIFNIMDFSPFTVFNSDPTNTVALSQMNSLLIGLSVNLFVFFILAILAWSATRILVYNTIYDKKWDTKLFLRLSLFNLVTFVLIIALSLLLSALLLPDFVGFTILIFLLIFAYLIYLYYIFYFKEQKFNKAISKTFAMFGKRTWLAFLIFLPFLAVVFLLAILSSLISGTIMSILSFLLLIGVFFGLLYINESKFPSPLLAIIVGLMVTVFVTSIFSAILNAVNATNNYTTGQIIGYLGLLVYFLCIAWLRFYTISTIERIGKK